MPYSRRLATTDMMVLRDAAVASLGILQLPILMVQDQLRDGTLIRLVED